MTLVYAFVVAVGCETEDSQIELLLKEVNGKDVAELIAVGREKLASVPSGGGGVAMASAPSAGGGGGAAPAEDKKEEKKEEKEESDDVSFTSFKSLIFKHKFIADFVLFVLICRTWVSACSSRGSVI